MDKPVVEIESRDYWLKIVGMLQHNWALIDEDPRRAGVTVYFVHDGSGVFDRMQFDSKQSAGRSLHYNGFRRYAEEDEDLKTHIKPPEPPFTEGHHPNGKIYSSGRYWGEPPTNYSWT
jgi:hypothetical protein